jgi:hypothetical protein
MLQVQLQENIFFQKTSAILSQTGRRPVSWRSAEILRFYECYIVIF